MRNQDVRQAAKESGVKLWEISDRLGLYDGNFSRKLRHELSPEEKSRIFEIIREIRGEHNGTIKN